ncbi:hypothetical protein [Holzapfeliella floricola]|uniref:hypothetical protein n=1 Tax=Holzapfeliella floricola TaxID=679249 RepID=UPI0007865688|nr:hypothetical protein [Holzapfeliella floricola]
MDLIHKVLKKTNFDKTQTMLYRISYGAGFEYGQDDYKGSAQGTTDGTTPNTPKDSQLSAKSRGYQNGYNLAYDGAQDAILNKGAKYDAKSGYKNIKWVIVQGNKMQLVLLPMFLLLLIFIMPL